MQLNNSLLSKKTANIDTSEIRKVFDLAKKIKNPYNLSIGQPDFPVPVAIKEALIKATQDNKNSYSVTKGIEPLRQGISEFLKKEIGNDYDIENILVSTGTAAILKLLFEILFDVGDGILMLDPYFIIYESLSNYHGLNKFYLDENFTKEDVENLLAKNPSIKAIVFSSPSNPSGKILTKEQLEGLKKISEKTNSLIISDEIYRAYDYDNSLTSIATIAPEQTLILNGFSKSHAMTGLRVGYIAVPKSLAFIVEKLATLQQYSIVCSPQPCQWAAVEALKTDISDLIMLMKKRRDFVVEKLTNKTKFSFPDGAFYLFPEVPISGQDFAMKAIEEKLLIVPGYIFSKKSNTIRISYAQPEETLDKGLNVFINLIEELKK